jgi:hypothetical protein
MDASHHTHSLSFFFFRLDTHINAAIAIVSLQGVSIAGRPARVRDNVLRDKEALPTCVKIIVRGHWCILFLQLSWGKDRSVTNANTNTYPYPAAAPPAPYLTQIPTTPTVWLDTNGQQTGLQPWMGVYYPPYQPQYHPTTTNEPPIEDTP